jgi:coenzyme PQQ precursor peptide PqqA
MCRTRWPDKALEEVIPVSILAGPWTLRQSLALYDIFRAETDLQEHGMAWETPTVTEIAVGLEVTAYVSDDEEVLP